MLYSSPISAMFEYKVTSNGFDGFEPKLIILVRFKSSLRIEKSYLLKVNFFRA